MKTDLFQKNLWSAQLVLETYGPDVKVYPCEEIFEAFDLSESTLRLKLFREHENEIEEASEEIELLMRNLNSQIVRLQKKYRYNFEGENFDAMHFLDFAAVDLSKFMEECDVDYLCWPENDRVSLAPCFEEYHIYKFHEEHMGFLNSGFANFLLMIPKMKSLLEDARIGETFFWDDNYIDFVYDFAYAIENLKSQHLERIEAKEAKTQRNQMRHL